MLENILYTIMLFISLLTTLLLFSYGEHISSENIYKLITVCAVFSLLYFLQRDDYDQTQEQARQIRVLKKEMEYKVNRKVVLMLDNDGKYLVIDKYTQGSFLTEVSDKKHATVFSGKEIEQANEYAKNIGARVIELR